MGRLIKIQDIDQFFDVVKIPDAAITSAILDGVRQLDERKELEPMLREVLCDPTETPHGPTEIADILTTKVRVRGERLFAAFVVKGKSFAKVRSEDIAHQVIRLRQLPNLGLMVLVAVGNIQDSAQRDFLQIAIDTGCDHLIIDAVDCARLLIAYEKICSFDGTRYDSNGSCIYGHERDKGIWLKLRVHGQLSYEIPRLDDVSHGLARRLSAVVLVNPSYDREVLREIIREATGKVKRSSYYRNRMVENDWRGTSAHVVWLYIAADLQDARSTNWIARTQWIDPNLNPQWRPVSLSASEYVDSIAVEWNESYKSMRSFFAEHSADKGEVLGKLEPLLDRAVTIGSKVIGLFDAFEKGEIEEQTLISHVRMVSPDIKSIDEEAGNMPFPPQDVMDYDSRAQSLFAHLSDMALYYSDSGVEIWPERNRTVLMRYKVKHFRADLDRLRFEKEKLR